MVDEDVKAAAWAALVDAIDCVDEIVAMLVDELLVQSDIEAENGNDARAEQLLQARSHVRRALFALRRP